ncbi:MAG: LacI family DNA-binding transcriptional regulator [Eubacteriales bacterium]|nr:LacI family DNA-binding transcriptional regulator [Eubacteriales bacterium]
MATRDKKSITLKDLARQTGYSINTISRALRDKDDIGVETREKIKKLAHDLGYVNNALAISLRLGVTKTIAVIFGDISNPHFAILMKEIEIRAREDGYTTILLNTMEDETLELEAIQTALNKNVDGIIICPAQKTTANLDYLQKSGLDFVLIGRRDDRFSYVICNDELGGFQATQALLAAGHRDILLLHGALYISSARERRAGYLRAFADAGLVVNEKLIREVPVVANGCEAVLAQLDAAGQPYSAIFAFSDMLAWEAWSCLQHRGKIVPGDCSIIGFDHIQSRLNLPFQLTSISTYKGQMSTTAVDILLRRMQGQEVLEQVVINTTLAAGDTIIRR